ncbi:hypothetical protein GCM10010428_49550 [Actinosynnema pretiosum subsp. pretiosum]
MPQLQQPEGNARMIGWPKSRAATLAAVEAMRSPMIRIEANARDVTRHAPRRLPLCLAGPAHPSRSPVTCGNSIAPETRASL